VYRKTHLRLLFHKIFKKGWGCSMARIQISEDPSGRIIASSPYALVLVSEVKSIEGRRWHPIEKHWSFPNTPYPPHRWGREREGMKKLELPACPVGRGLSPKFNASSKPT
jgi:hypothetical protein